MKGIGTIKKKMRAFACAAATTLAFVPVLGGCPSADASKQIGAGVAEQQSALEAWTACCLVWR